MVEESRKKNYRLRRLYERGIASERDVDRAIDEYMSLQERKRLYRLEQAVTNELPGLRNERK